MFFFLTVVASLKKLHRAVLNWFNGKVDLIYLDIVNHDVTDLSGSQSIPPGPDTRPHSTGDTTTQLTPKTHDRSIIAIHFIVMYFIYWSYTLPVI